MPLSEFLKLVSGKLQSSQQETCSNEPFSRAENGLLELVWENGQIVMQDQSSKVNQSNNNPQNAPSNAPRIRDPGLLHAPNKIGKYGEVETILDGISPVVVPSSDIDLTQDDDMIRWLSCPIDDPLHQDYCSDLIPEISGVTATQDTVLPVDKGTSCFKTFGSNLHEDNTTLRASTSSLKPCFGSGVSSDVITNNPSNHQSVMYNSSSRGKSLIDDTIMSRQNIQYLPTNGMDLMNFSHFLKPVFLAKPHDPTPGTLPNVAPSLPVKKIGFSEKVAYSSGKSAVMEQLMDGDLVNSRQPMAKENTERRENDLCQESCTRNKKQSEAANNSRRGVSDANEKIAEAVVVTSSVGSGNSADRLSYGQTQNSKRKYPDDSECRSDDVETESVGVKKPTNTRGGNGSKRSRAAEVHNLSERRRRDRINEKMRALQELIPNCNKADKASMLDEAIEYLKTLQLQVQMMSMGAGLCMPPPIMYPHPTHFPRLTGMGVGMGYGSHMFPLNSPYFPRISPCSNIPGYGNLGQGIPGLVLPRPPPPPIPPLVHPMNGGGGPHVTTTTTTTTTHLNLSASGRSGVPCSSLPLHNVTEDSVMYKNSQLMCNSEDGGSLKHISSQQAANEGVNESMKVVQENEQTTDKVNNDNNLCRSSSTTELNKEEAGN